MRKAILFCLIFCVLGTLGWVSRGWFGDVSKYQDEISDLEKVNSFDEDSLKVFSEMEGEFYKETFIVTSYYPSPKQGGIYNAFGMRLKPNISCATDWKLIPPGSILNIDGKIFVVDDNGSHVEGNEIDICLPTSAEVESWGNKELEVWVFVPKKE